MARNRHASVTRGGQIASENLDTAEKMALGGPFAVRGHPRGEAQADEVHARSIEARYKPSQLAADVPDQLLFVVGTSHVSRKPGSTADNRRTLSGGGFGVSRIARRNLVVN